MSPRRVLATLTASGLMAACAAPQVPVPVVEGIPTISQVPVAKSPTTSVTGVDAGGFNTLPPAPTR